MKHITILIICIIALSCKENKKQIATPKNTKIETVTNKIPKIKPVKAIANITFLEDIKSLEKDTSNNPIQTFKTAASTTAKEVISLNKTNIEQALANAKNYKYAVITVEDHTIVKLNLDDCKPSGAWSACMPKAEGYIKKGDLVYQNDYANNIIGLPNTQERILYLF